MRTTLRRTGRSRVIAALSLCLLSSCATVSSHSDEEFMNAIELLTAFTGSNASQHELLFQYIEESRIVGVESYAVGMKNTTAKYSGQEDAWHEVNNILRIKTADGFEGVSGVDTYYQGGFSDEHWRELQSAIDDLLAVRSLDPVIVSSWFEKMRPDLSDAAIASIDIALWDLAARRAKRPLYELLGASRKSMTPYASFPFYETLPEYVEAVRQYSKLGFTIFKFHVWGAIEKDLELVKLMQQTFSGSDYRFMVDLESMYSFEEALRLGRQMDEGLFFWFEAPIDDSALVQYAKLRSRLASKIIPAGYNIYSAEFIRQGMQAGSWDAGRFDATVVGGISKALELLVIANKADFPVDIQSWGHSLAQAANLHLMIANERTPYFEAPMPKYVFEFGMKDGDLLDEGRAVAPTGPGLGIEINWEQLSTADFYVSSE